MSKLKWLLFSLLLFFLFPISIFADTDKSVETLVIHYYRYQNDYEDDWNLWLWPENGNGKRVDFDYENETIVTDDYGAVATFKLTENYKNVNRIGIIIRKGEWVEKDISFDRFIDIPAAAADGILHVYFVEGDEKMGYSANDPNGPDRSNKIKSAFFSIEDEITFTLTKALSADKIKLSENGIELAVSVTIQNNKGKIKLDKEVDFANKYILSAEFDDGIKSYNVTFDGIYDSPAFEEAFAYNGDDLGAIVSADKTTFRLWAPISSAVGLNIYSTGTPAAAGGTDNPIHSYAMEKSVKGTWKYELSENLHGKYYTYSVTNGSRTIEVIDPYAKSAGVNGLRGMIVDFEQVNPEGFTYNDYPNNIEKPTDAIIYELHVRDLTSHSSWNGPDEYRGKFLGMAVEGTKYQNVTTGFDHIKELGVTHVQILPFFDFGVINETKLNDPSYQKFNWGYMPLNFNVPEGAYSTDPYDGTVRITELKQTIKAYNHHNIGIIMDVVYNHTGLSADSNFHLIVPGYYHRLNSEGGFYNGSGTGNETASERTMMRKFIVDSVTFWAKEYNISGFRFDLMALHDVDTMNQITSALTKINPNILIYGEPWMGGTSPLPESEQAGKINLINMPYIAAFNDDFRDGVKGSVFNKTEKGFVQGQYNQTTINKIKYGIVGGIDYPGIDYGVISHSVPWHTSPNKSINYVSAHDNNTLYDKLRLSTDYKQLEFIPQMQKQANAIVLTAQGIPFIHAGAEFLRSKPLGGGQYDENSYESPDTVNQLRWDLKAQTKNLDVYEYYKGLIALRKNHPAFRMNTAEDVINHLEFLYPNEDNIIAYQISGHINNDVWDKILVIHNNGLLKSLKLPSGEWHMVANSQRIDEEIIRTYPDGGKLTILEHETVILYQGRRDPNDNKKGCLFFNIQYLSCPLLLIGFEFIKRKKDFFELLSI